jgi:hypothetical protein
MELLPIARIVNAAFSIPMEPRYTLTILYQSSTAADPNNENQVTKYGLTIQQINAISEALIKEPTITVLTTAIRMEQQ